MKLKALYFYDYFNANNIIFKEKFLFIFVKNNIIHIIRIKQIKNIIVRNWFKIKEKIIFINENKNCLKIKTNKNSTFYNVKSLKKIELNSSSQKIIEYYEYQNYFRIVVKNEFQELLNLDKSLDSDSISDEYPDFNNFDKIIELKNNRSNNNLYKAYKYYIFNKNFNKIKFAEIKETDKIYDFQELTNYLKISIKSKNNYFIYCKNKHININFNVFNKELVLFDFYEYDTFLQISFHNAFNNYIYNKNELKLQKFKDIGNNDVIVYFNETKNFIILKTVLQEKYIYSKNSLILMKFRNIKDSSLILDFIETENYILVKVVKDNYVHIYNRFSLKKVYIKLIKNNNIVYNFKETNKFVLLSLNKDFYNFIFEKNSFNLIIFDKVNKFIKEFYEYKNYIKISISKINNYFIYHSNSLKLMDFGKLKLNETVYDFIELNNFLVIYLRKNVVYFIYDAFYSKIVNFKNINKNDIIYDVKEYKNFIKIFIKYKKYLVYQNKKTRIKKINY